MEPITGDTNFPRDDELIGALTGRAEILRALVGLLRRRDADVGEAATIARADTVDGDDVERVVCPRRQRHPRLLVQGCNTQQQH